MTITLKLKDPTALSGVPYYQKVRIDLKSHDKDYFYGSPIDLFGWNPLTGRIPYGILPYPKYAWEREISL